MRSCHRRRATSNQPANAAMQPTILSDLPLAVVELIMTKLLHATAGKLCSGVRCSCKLLRAGFDAANTHMEIRIPAQDNLDESASCFWGLVQASTRLEHLSIRVHRVPGSMGHSRVADVLALVQLLEMHSSLRHLHLHNTCMGDEGAKAVAEVLKSSTTLQHVGLSGNRLGIEGVKALAEALEMNTSLQHLDLSDNLWDKVGCMVLAEMLKDNHSLQELNLSSNSIYDEGCSALAGALKLNTALLLLDLSGCGLGEGSGEALADALKVNSTLQHLNLSGNRLVDHDGNALARALMVNSTLLFLDVSRNIMRDHGIVWTSLLEVDANDPPHSGELRALPSGRVNFQHQQDPGTSWLHEEPGEDDGPEGYVDGLGDDPH